MPRLVALLVLAALPASGESVLFSNGPLVNLPFGGYGGAHASRVQDELGLATLAFGGGNLVEGDGSRAMAADDFVVPGPWSWHVTGFTVFASDFPFPPGAGKLTVWNAPPWQVGATQILTGSAGWSGDLGYRVRTSDPLAQVPAIRSYDLEGSWTLSPGTYWLSWSPGFTFLSPHQDVQAQVPPVTVPGATVTGNGRVGWETCYFFVCGYPIQWQDALDAGTGTGQGFPFVIRGGPAAARKGDLGDPGGPDLLFRNTNPASADFNRNKAWLMNGTARASEAFLAPDPSGSSWRIVAVDDFDTAGAPWNGPDGQADILLRDGDTGALEFWMMNGTERVGAALPLSGASAPSPAWEVAASADFDGDARPDLLWQHSSSGQLVVWFMDGSALRSGALPAPDHATDGNWRVVAAQDFDDDGAPDLLWYNSSSGRVVLWFLDTGLHRTSGRFLVPPQAGDSNWDVVASADFSRASAAATPPPGSPDLVWRNRDSGRLVVWHLDFAGSRVFGEFTTPASNTPALDWQVVGPR